MPRIIKFRYKVKGLEEFIYSDRVRLLQNNRTILVDVLGVSYTVEREEQCTGLKTINEDGMKNDIDVYEGDTLIVGKSTFRYQDEVDVPCYQGKVIWAYGGFCLKITKTLIDMTLNDVGGAPYLGEFLTIFEVVQ